MKLKTLFFMAMLFCGGAPAAPVTHRFSLWDIAKTQSDKVYLYWGWTNGFLQGRGSATPHEKEVLGRFVDCLYAMDAKQAIAMVDKYYRDHPEKWGDPFGEQMLLALTASGGPCGGISF